MKRFLCFVALVGTSLCAAEFPQLKAHVNDYASLMSPATQRRIEARLSDLEKTDSTQIVVLTVESLEGETIEQYSIKLAEVWRIGVKGKDNGILIVVAKEERKVRIEVGYGLEGALTDLQAGRIIRQAMIPLFQQGDYDQGISAGVELVIKAVKGEFAADKRQNKGDEKSASPYIIIFAIVTAIIARIKRIAGGMLGAIGLPFILYFFVGSFSLGFILAMIPIGFFLGIISPNIAFLPFGGGGGSGGGSFGGGGGRFGGGGASGGW